MKKFTLYTKISLLATLSLILTACPDDNPNDPDSTSLKGKMYVSGNVSSAIYEIDLTTGSVDEILVGTEAVLDGNNMIYISNDGIEEIDDLGKSRIILERDVWNEFKHDDEIGHLQLSPDGAYIAYEGSPDNGDIFVIDRYNGEMIYQYYVNDNVEGYSKPTWTNENKLVVAGMSGNQGLYLIDPFENITYTLNAELNNPYQPAVSPDDSQVAFVMAGSIYIMNLDGTSVKKISSSALESSFPVWSPDGKWIAYFNNSNILAYSLSNNQTYDVSTISNEVKVSLLNQINTTTMQIFWKY